MKTSSALLIELHESIKHCDVLLMELQSRATQAKACLLPYDYFVEAEEAIGNWFDSSADESSL
jgi:hypothetical protein